LGGKVYLSGLPTAVAEGRSEGRDHGT
jgi:hypothetical protein